MPRYEKYTTTVIGAHSVPRWYEALDRLVVAGSASRGDFADAQLRATQAAILEQEIAGIDVITGGEMHRRTHNRHAPPNAMLNHFWQKIPSFQGETKPKPITPHDPNVFHPAAICRGPIIDTIDLGLVDEFKTVSSFARKPVKITMTGPHLLAAVAYDEYYDDIARDDGRFRQAAAPELQEACRGRLQAYPDRRALFHGRRAMRRCGGRRRHQHGDRGLPDDVHVMVHICQGNYAVGPDYDGQIGHRYFDTGRYKADLICQIDCDAFLIEHDMTPHYEGCSATSSSASARSMCRRRTSKPASRSPSASSAHRWLAPEQTIITSSCGFNHLPRHIALGKLRAMSEAKAILTGS